MSSIDLTQHQRSRLTNELGLIKLTTNGYDRYFDPQTGARYTISPSGYVLRKTEAGSYQVNPRFKVRANKAGTRQVQATVRFTEPGAVTELAVRAVENYRRYANR